jgi:hypothetical protein
MKGHRLVITFVAVALVAALIGAGAAATRGTPDWLDALNARSAALNERYGLGDDAGRRTLGAPGPSWLEALMARSDAMNREHGLGDYVRQTSRASSTPDWLAALNVRSDSLNRKYGLGEYAPKG